MIDLVVMIACCVPLSYVVQSRMHKCNAKKIKIQYDIQFQTAYMIIMILFILFAGLRSKYNDTTTYMEGFELLDKNAISIYELKEAYGGFEVYQKLIKLYISDNPQALIFISAALTNILYICYIKKHSENFCASMFLYSIGNYIFCMAGIKQAIAIGISLYAIDMLFRRKHILFVLLLILAMSFHPYIICLLVIPLLKNKVWDWKTILVIIVSVVLFMNLENLFGFISSFGQDYSMENFETYTINPFRVVVESIPIIISFLFYKTINDSNDKFLILGVNMRIISFVFIGLGLFYTPIYLGRMSAYFTALSSIVTPKMLKICFGKQKAGKIIILAYYLFLFVYFILDMTKLGTISLAHDQFAHVGITNVF